jgi:hypothetical protein
MRVLTFVIERKAINIFLHAILYLTKILLFSIKGILSFRLKNLLDIAFSPTHRLFILFILKYFCLDENVAQNSTGSSQSLANFCLISYIIAVQGCIDSKLQV